MCNASYWVHNLRRTVRFAAAVRAALEDGYRVFAELAPHPLLTHAVEQTADSLDIPLATLAACVATRHFPTDCGLGGRPAQRGCGDRLLGALSGWAVVDAPLPTWTHRPLWLDHDGHESPAHGGCTVSVHPLLGPHVRLQEEPERHVWQAQFGTAAQPWLADHRIRDVAVLPGAAYCEMALAAAGTVLGETAEVRDIHFEQALLLDEHTAVGASTSSAAPGVVEFAVDADQGNR